MLIPDADVNNYDNYNFEQSSNRMHIECAFGLLVNKWAILWKPLDIKFIRRVPLINACFHLHNFCIDRRVMQQNYLMFDNIFVQVQPTFAGRSAVWMKNPKFDKKGRPVEYLNWIRTSKSVGSSNVVEKSNKYVLRNRFVRRIEKKKPLSSNET